jgi:hypothetical protein
MANSTSGTTTRADWVDNQHVPVTIHFVEFFRCVSVSGPILPFFLSRINGWRKTFFGTGLAFAIIRN